MHTDWETSESAEDYSRNTAAAQWEPMGYPAVFRSLALATTDSDNAPPILDYGCGPGFVDRHVAEKYGRRVIAVDISSSMIDLARSQHSHPLVTYRHVPDSQLDFLGDKEIGGCMSCFVLMQMADSDTQVEICRRIRRTLAPGAMLAVLNTHPDSVGIQFATLRNGEPDRVYQPGDPMTTVLTTDKGVLRLQDYYWRVTDYVHALEAAGFHEVTVEHLPPPPADPTPHPQFLLVRGTA
ncbi:hypothetical protein A3L22_30500 [Streptomyces griseus subsp. griseus]|uniref:N-demethylindolmycin N-methyltransferase n=2 Tax=Streptomyces TaxID=1883 RepID=IND7_STRGR|nr:RecName: Full=N-demethylindolmycin N-methyltransferase [Streptomyces griseus]AJT38688.1 Ind7 [Streptomyces griseus subsp. griseus]TVP35647.1 hypothetical protein A3L22_30500 [Streptomyces griseus subsp. griseus]